MAQLRTLMEELEQNGLLFDQFVDAEVARLNALRADAENMNAEAKGWETHFSNFFPNRSNAGPLHHAMACG
jgi:hypothetical protein